PMHEIPQPGPLGIVQRVDVVVEAVRKGAPGLHEPEGVVATRVAIPEARNLALVVRERGCVPPTLADLRPEAGSEAERVVLTLPAVTLLRTNVPGHAVGEARRTTLDAQRVLLREPVAIE